MALAVLGGLALIANASLAVVNVRQIRDASAWVEHTHRVLEKLQGVLSSLTEAETGQRGFLITGERAYLAPYEAGARAVRRELSELAALTRDNPGQQQAIDSLRPLALRKLDELQRTVELRQGPGGAEAARAVVLTGEGRRLMDAVRDRGVEIAARERQLLAARGAEAARAARIAVSTSLAGFAASFALLATAFGSIRKRLRERERAAARRRVAQRELERRAALLEEQDRRKNQFLAVLSHELRNPLAPIRNAVLLLRRADPAGAQARHAREVIERQLAQMTRLVEDLLDVSRIAQGKIRLQREPIALDDAVRRTVEDHRSLFRRRGIALEVRAPAAPLPVDADPTRLVQVIGNLLQNAAKFTDRGGRVTVELAAEGERALLRVRDDGTGMDPETLAGLFRPFVQAENTLARTRGGLGLGLALARELVELHGGRITACSEGLGKGTEFVVSLPLAGSPGAERPRAPAPAARSLSLLVIDDNEDAAVTLRDLLELDGHRVAVATDGRQGVDAALAACPDVVLCDIGLPEMDGYEVARRLRAAGSRARLVALSGYAMPEDAERARAAGFDDHLAKPADRDKLVAILASTAEREAGSGKSA